MKTFFTLLIFAFSIKAQAQFITTIAGNGTQGYSGDGSLSVSASLYDPYKICLDAAGNIYFSDCSNHSVRKINVNGIISTVAGGSFPGFSGDGGLATSAELNFPYGVFVDALGNLFIADIGNNRIRKVDVNGIITTVAGAGTQGYSGDGGPATSAELNGSSNMIVDASGNIFIADSYNHRIRKVDTSGVITSIAGAGISAYGGDGAQATIAYLSYPCDLTLDLAGNLLIADAGNNCIRKINSSGIISTIAGNGTPGYGGDGGPSVSSLLYGPVDVDVDDSGNIYITEQYNSYIRKIDTSGIINTIAGNGVQGYGGDGGQATAASFKLPSGLAYKNNKIYITDYHNERIRMICSSTVSTSLSASPTLLCAGYPSTLTASGANTYSYSWSTSQTGINHISVSPADSTTYYVQGKDTNGCVGSSSVTVRVNACVGVKELSNNSQVKIYPNPTASELTISEMHFVNTTSKITIINSLGQVVKSTSVSENSTDVYKINVEDLKTGLYFISIENGSKITTKLFNKIE